MMMYCNKSFFVSTRGSIDNFLFLHQYSWSHKRLFKWGFTLGICFHKETDGSSQRDAHIWCLLLMPLAIYPINWWTQSSILDALSMLSWVHLSVYMSCHYITVIYPINWWMQSSNLDALSMLSWVHLIVYLPRLYIKSASLIVGMLHFHFNVRLSITFL